MKMLMIIIAESKREQLEVFLNHAGVAGYTELSHAAGMGASGPRLGSRAFPRTSAVVFSILDEDLLPQLMTGIAELCATCGDELKMVSWDVEVLR